MPKRSRESETPFNPSSSSSTSASQQQQSLNTSTFIPPPTSNPSSRGKKPFNPRDGGFQQDILRLMAAFGDCDPPLASTAAILEEITLDYLTDLLHRSRPSPYSLPISSSKINPNHPLNHILDTNNSTSNGSTSMSTSGNGNPDPLNAPTGRSGYAYPPKATIHPDDIRRALRKLGPKPILIPKEKKQKRDPAATSGAGKDRGDQDQEQDQDVEDGDEGEVEVEEGILNRELERFEEILYLSKMIDGAQKGVGQSNAELAKFGNDDT